MDLKKKIKSNLHREGMTIFSSDNSSFCPGNQFRCNDGQCVAGDSLCNSVRDCRDGSDEGADICGEFR